MSINWIIAPTPHAAVATKSSFKGNELGKMKDFHDLA